MSQSGEAFTTMSSAAAAAAGASSQEQQQFRLRWTNHRANLLAAFDDLFHTESLTDATLVCEGGAPLRCHRVVLAACSPYFNRLFAQLDCKHPVVILKDVKFEEIRAVLEYMYRGEVNVAQGELGGLLRVAEALKVKGLVEENENHEKKEDKKAFERDEGLGMIEETEMMKQTDDAGSTSKITTTCFNPSLIHSSTANFPSSSTSNNNNNNSPSSPHSTNGYTNCYGGYPPKSHPYVPPVWLSQPQSMPATQGHHHHQQQHHQFGGFEEDQPMQMKKRRFSSFSSSASVLSMVSRDTPILRTVLGQGHVDSSSVRPPVGLPGDGGCQEDRPIKNEPSEDAQSPYTDLQLSIDNEDKATKMAVPPTSIPPTSPLQPYSSTGSDLHGSPAISSISSIANYVPAQKPEWKRYKQYTRNDIMSAIEAVRGGMSALQAARKYGVPSRTLYDKVKKLGITTSRPFKRGGGSCFPYGSDDLDRNMTSINSSSCLLEASSFLQQAMNHQGTGEQSMEMLMSSPKRSQSPIMLKYLRQSQNSLHSSPETEKETNGSSDHDQDQEQDQVEDLSIKNTRKNQVSTIVNLKELKGEEAGGGEMMKE